MSKRLVRADLVVVPSPVVIEFARVIKAGKPRLSEALVSKFAVEALDETVFHGSARRYEVQLDATFPRPEIERFTCELRAVVDHDRLWPSILGRRAIESAPDALAGDGVSDLHRDADARAIVDDIEYADASTVVERVAHEVHRPPFMRAIRNGLRFPRCRRYAFASLSANLQLFFAVDAIGAFLVHHESVAPKKNVDSRVAETRS